MDVLNGEAQLDEVVHNLSLSKLLLLGPPHLNVVGQVFELTVFHHYN
jgi:hypothetical protein